MTTHKVLALVEDECVKLTEADSVLYIPDPELNGLTDEDSYEWDDKKSDSINNFGHRMLNTMCDVFPHYRDKAAKMDSPPTSGLSLATTTKKKQKKAKVSQEIFWPKEFPVFDVNVSKLIVKLVDDDVLSVATELESMKMFITENFINEILNQPNLYAQQKNVLLNVTKNELQVVFGAFLLSGYAKYPNKRLY